MQGSLKLGSNAGASDLQRLERLIVSCELCPRLRSYARSVEANKPARFADSPFWGRPVPGFGDISARVLIIGLAPARTGALRTGRIFTGDASSRFLMGALYQTGFTNQAESESRDDGLVYHDAYITAALKCAPPGDKPLPEEMANCSVYLEKEISLLTNLQSVLVLGSLAFRSYLDHLKRSGVETGRQLFRHDGIYHFKGLPTLYASYHPSPRNTNTGKLTKSMLVAVLNRIRKDLA